MILAAALSLVVGIVLGALGGGGSILLLPLLVYVVGLDPKEAIAMSLFVVGSTSLAGGTVHARAGTVSWKQGSLFGAAAMAGAFAGGRVAHLVAGAVLVLIFAVVMLATAGAMLAGRPQPPAAPRASAVPRMLMLGVAVGFVSGLVGAGGGFLIVPALTLFAGLGMREAIGTSLFVIAVQSFAGFAGHFGHTRLDWALVAIVTAAAVTGTVGGSLVARSIPQGALRKSFAWLVLAMGLVVIGKQAPPFVTIVVATITLIAVAAIVRRKGHSTAAETCTTSPRFPH